jgi:hypothetical protein
LHGVLVGDIAYDTLQPSTDIRFSLLLEACGKAVALAAIGAATMNTTATKQR